MTSEYSDKTIYNEDTDQLDVYKNNILVGSIFCGFKLDPDILNSILWTKVYGQMSWTNAQGGTFQIGGGTANAQLYTAEVISSSFKRGNYTKLTLLGSISAFGTGNGTGASVKILGDSQTIAVVDSAVTSSAPIILDETLNLAAFDADEEIKIKVKGVTYSNWYIDVNFIQIKLIK